MRLKQACAMTENVPYMLIISAPDILILPGVCNHARDNAPARKMADYLEKVCLRKEERRADQDASQVQSEADQAAYVDYLELSHNLIQLRS